MLSVTSNTPTGRGGGTKIHFALTVDGRVGVVATVVGGGEEPRHQRRVRELIAEQLLHHRQPARDHGRGIGCPSAHRSPPLSVGALVGAVKGVRHLFPGGREAIVAGDTAAIGKARDG